MRKLAFILFFFLFLCLRFIHLPQSINFGSDQGRDFLTTWNMYTHKQLTLIGPPSQYTVDGRQFFFGPAPYYFILPALVAGHGDPLVVSSFLILLNAMALLVALLVLDRYIKNKAIVYLFAIVCTYTPSLVRYSQSYWNPYFLLPVSIGLVALLVRSKYISAKSVTSFSLIGFLLGLGLQFHYSFILAILMAGLWLLLTKKISWVSFCCLLGGFVVGFSPVLLFELRNHFYNLTTLLLFLRNSKSSSGGIGLNSYYLISLLPFLFYFLSVILSKLWKKNSSLIYLICSVYIVLSFFIILPVPKNILPYPLLQELAKTIQADNPGQYNIVDQQTGDNRALALRYLLTDKLPTTLRSGF